MTKVIIISNSNLDGLYQQTLHYLHDKYHQYPSSLSGRSLTEAEMKMIANNVSQPSLQNNYPNDECLGKNVY